MTATSLHADRTEAIELVDRLYATEQHARIIAKDEEQPLTVLLRDVRQYLERAASKLGTDQADPGEQGGAFATSGASPAPIAWMHSGHIEAYRKVGSAAGIAWASPVQNQFYDTAVFAAAHVEARP